MTLNPSKTYQVSYGKKLVHSVYFLKNKVIEKTSTVRDLGVIFDEDLTFKQHIEYLNKRTIQMIGAARRFVNGINYPMLITKIYRIYIQSVIEYCSVVWNQNRLTANNVLTLAHKKITRNVLNIYHTMDPAKYINYEKRFEILNQDNPSIRRTTQAATLCVKILKGEAILSFSNLIIFRPLQHQYRSKNISPVPPYQP